MADNNNPTPEEKKLAEALRERGVEVTVHKPFSYTKDGKTREIHADLCVEKLKLVIEADGGHHTNGLPGTADVSQVIHDRKRDSTIRRTGYDRDRVGNALINDPARLRSYADQIAGEYREAIEAEQNERSRKYFPRETPAPPPTPAQLSQLARQKRKKQRPTKQERVERRKKDRKEAQMWKKYREAARRGKKDREALKRWKKDREAAAIKAALVQTKKKKAPGTHTRRPEPVGKKVKRNIDKVTHAADTLVDRIMRVLSLIFFTLVGLAVFLVALLFIVMAMYEERWFLALFFAVIAFFPLRGILGLIAENL